MKSDICNFYMNPFRILGNKMDRHMLGQRLAWLTISLIFVFIFFLKIPLKAQVMYKKCCAAYTHKYSPYIAGSGYCRTGRSQQTRGKAVHVPVWGPGSHGTHMVQVSLTISTIFSALTATVQCIYKCLATLFVSNNNISVIPTKKIYKI